MQGFPSFHFNKDLQEVPDSIKEFMEFIKHITTELKDASTLEKKRQLLSQLGAAYRIIRQLDKAEIYLKEALYLSYKTKNVDFIFSSWIRLAHCFQWQQRFKLSNSIFIKLQQNAVMESNLSLKSFFWQHKGKNAFDQGHFIEASNCFEKSLQIRVEHKLSQELIDSAQFSLSETKKGYYS